MASIGDELLDKANENTGMFGAMKMNLSKTLKCYNLLDLMIWKTV